MATFDNPSFQRVADSLGAGLAASSANSFSLVFDDDVTATVSLCPGGDDVAVDIWCHDAARLTGAVRRAVVETLLTLSAAAQAGRPFRIGLDSRDFVLVHARASMAGMADDEAFTDWLDWSLEQGRRVRSLVRTLSFEDARLGFTLAPAHGGGA